MRFFLIAIVFYACSSSVFFTNQKKEGHFRLYSYPEDFKNTYDSEKYKRITIVASNNFEGEIAPTSYKIPNRNNEQRSLSVGGLAAAKAYYNIFENKYKNELLFVDSGSFMAQDDSPQNMIFLYNYLGVDVTTLGINEFSLNSKYYPNRIQSILNKAQFKIVNSNFFDLTTAEELKWKNISETYIKEVDGVKVGFIGLFPTKNKEKVPTENIKDIFIQDQTRIILTHSNILRKEGAQMVVLLYSGSLDCTTKLSKELEINPKKVNFDPNAQDVCQLENNELANTISRLPSKKIDLIISNGTSSKAVNYIYDTPVLQNFGKSRYLSWGQFYFDKKFKSLIYDKTKLFQPIKLCHEFLEKTQDCYMEEDFEDNKVIPATFLGEKVNISPIPSYK